jgi:hypothetical protein
MQPMQPNPPMPTADPFLGPARTSRDPRRMRRARRTTAAVVVGAVLAVAAPGVASAHSGAHDSDTAQAMTVSQRSAGATGKTVPTDSSAAELRAALTALLQEHVYLAGIATGTALGGGDLTAPAQTLDQNSIALSDAIGSVYGDAAGEQFLALWRKHIQFFVDYTTATATGDATAKAQAAANLDQYREDFGAFLASANPNLPKEAVAEELQPHVATLFAAIDAQAAKDPSQYEKLREAASHMPMTAKVLAAGIATQFPKKFKR